MDIKAIKNTREFFWTNHSKYKLLQYGISPTIVKKVIRRPERIEDGIAPETVAVMMRKDTKKTERSLGDVSKKERRKNVKNKNNFYLDLSGSESNR